MKNLMGGAIVLARAVQRAAVSVRVRRLAKPDLKLQNAFL